MISPVSISHNKRIVFPDSVGNALAISLPGGPVWGLAPGGQWPSVAEGRQRVVGTGLIGLSPGPAPRCPLGALCPFHSSPLDEWVLTVTRG